MTKPSLTGSLLICILMLCSCQTAYFDTLEKFGIHKRDLLIDRVEDARDSQLDAKEQFKSALEEFSALVNFKGGDLEQNYNELDAEYNQSKMMADQVEQRINDVENVSKALFNEWEEELDEYQSASLRRQSEQNLKQTQAQYQQLITAMKRAEKKMQPVMATLKDQVLFAKHNLNTKAIQSLQLELDSIEADTADLIREMEASIREANSFINGLDDRTAKSSQ